MPKWDATEKDASERSMAVNVSSFCLEAVITRGVEIGGVFGLSYTGCRYIHVLDSLGGKGIT